MTRKEDDVADIAVILAVTVKMAVLLACVIVYCRYTAIWACFIFSDYGSRRFL
jgi:hypothetical protein